ncbi:MAG: hypothetical protein WC510_04545 [Candidatus Omnitrophota bacterium]
MVKLQPPLKFFLIIAIFTGCLMHPEKTILFAQGDDWELTVDINSATMPLPKIFRPNMDLSGRGFYRQNTWPQVLASEDAINTWQQDIGLGGIYRLQYNLWEISQLSKDRQAQDKLLENYENIIKRITEAGGIVILDIFGTPAGQGRVLDKRSPPWDMASFRALIKAYIQKLSCEKRYNIWYEVWSAPDLDDFFLGRKQEYLLLYRAIAEVVKELEAVNKIHIPLGGPSTSWWFHNLDTNTVFTPERSLVYELIKFCYAYRLPLDFISWHAYSTSPRADKEITIYRQDVTSLIRDWLSYFHFDRDTLLIVDEWNFDSDANIIAERKAKAHISASYIPSRLKNMYEAGIDYQLYFSLEDFQGNKGGVNRNVGVFWFDPERSEYKGGPKNTYNVFRMLSLLGKNMFVSSQKINDDFIGAIATKSAEDIVILVYNYIDPDIVKSFLSNNIAALSGAERKALLNLIKSKRLEKVINQEADIDKLHTTKRLKSLLKKARGLNEKAAKFKTASRNIKLGIKNLKVAYTYQRYVVDSSCSLNCPFEPVETKEINAGEVYQEVLSASPYSVHCIILKKKPAKENNITAQTAPQEAAAVNKAAKENSSLPVQGTGK